MKRLIHQLIIVGFMLFVFFLGFSIFPPMQHATTGCPGIQAAFSTPTKQGLNATYTLNASFSCNILNFSTQYFLACGNSSSRPLTAQLVQYTDSTVPVVLSGTFAPTASEFASNNDAIPIYCSAYIDNDGTIGGATQIETPQLIATLICTDTSCGYQQNNNTNHTSPSPVITDCLQLDHGLGQCAYGSCPAPLSPLSQGNQSCQQIYGKGRKNASSGTCCGPTTGNQCGKCLPAGSYCSGTPGYCENSIQCSNGQPVVQVYKCDTTHHAWLPPYNQTGNSTCFTNPCTSPGGFKGSDYQCPNNLPSGDTCCYSVAKNTCYAGNGGTGFNPPTCNYLQPNTSPILCPGQSGSTGTFVISGSIWLDTNGDGQWNNNEQSSNFTGSPQITLQEPGGQTLNTTPTGGGYSFHNLASGTYSITVSGFTPTNASSLQNIQLSQNMNKVNIGDNSNISPSPILSPATSNVFYTGCAGFDAAHSTCLYSPNGDSCSTATSGKYVTDASYISSQAHITNDSCGNNAPSNVPSGKTVLCCVPPNVSPSSATSPSPKSSPSPSPSSGTSQGPLGTQACGPSGIGKCFKNACGGQYPDASFAQAGTGICNTSFGSSAICCGPNGSVGPLHNSSGFTQCGPNGAGACYWNSCSSVHPTAYGGPPGVCASTYGSKAICCH